MKRPHEVIDQPAQAEPPVPAEPPAKGTLAPISRPNVSWAVDINTPLSECPTNLDPSRPEHRRLMVAATQVPDYQLDSKGRLTIRATHYLVYGDVRVNEQTGEEETVRCSVLIDRDGKIYRTTGIFAYRAVRAAAFCFAPEDWARGIPFVVQARLTANRRIAHDVRVVLDMEDYPGQEYTTEEGRPGR